MLAVIRRWALIGVCLLAALSAACMAPTPSALRPGLTLEMVTEGAGASPTVADVIASRISAPLASRVSVWRERVAPHALVTVTVVTYADTKGALTLFNGFFAERAFPASADRRTLDIGDEAEAVDMGWPPFHAIYARQGRHFVLVEASEALSPPDRRVAVLTDLARHTLAAETLAPATQPGRGPP